MEPLRPSDNPKKAGPQHKTLKMIAKFFNKGKRTASVPEVDSDDQKDSDAVSNSNLDTEMEALHLSRTDNPYLQILSSQDNLDQATPPPIGSTTPYFSDQPAPESLGKSIF